MNKRELFTLYVLNILAFEESVISAKALYRRVFEKHESEILHNGHQDSWKKDCYRAIKWLTDRDMLVRKEQFIFLPTLIEVDCFEVDEYTVHIHQRDDVLHAQLKGNISLGGNYSARIDNVPGQSHVHIYEGQNQICSMNADGSGHDGFTGTRIPNKVVRAIKKKREFKNFNLPPNNVLTLFTYPFFP
ncbi:hypothetical protein [Vibrio parahaemolyticus]|uniref:hypothetical protein n=1 Tax=Vibrio parahaemolyticus TaxID=670 RepID=UPI0007B6F06B|nr:hypothetical protein [Vibrio parahaemolyticus]ANB96701.1 hypothetical protein FORC14_1940 [Vibrio parahaemolyticus]